MREMFFDLALRNPQELRQLVRGQQRAGQQFDEALAGSVFGGRHAAIIGERWADEKTGIAHIDLGILGQNSCAIPR